MPTVPRYGQPKVGTAPLPGVRISTGAPSEAFQPTPQLDTSGVQKLLGEVIADQKKKADTIAITDAESQLADTETELLYNPKTGLLNRKGKDAFGIPEEFNDSWQQRISDISASLGNDDQKLAFDIAQKRRHSDVNRIVQRHVSGEIKDYDNSTTESFLKNERNTAIASYNDPERVDLAIQRQVQAILKFGDRNGLPEEKIAEMTANAVSDTHVGVISHMLANDEDLNAKAYYDKHKPEITGVDSVNIEKSLAEGSSRGESQRQADAIVRKYPNRGDALQEVAKIKDAKIRDLTEDRVNHFFSARKQVEQDLREDLYMQATNMIDAQPGAPARTVVPPHIWSKLSLDQRGALERRSSGDDANLPHDSKTYLSFMDLTPQQTASLSQAEFETRYWSKFDKPHREHATEIWASARDAIRTGKGQSDKVISMLNLQTRIKNTLKKNKIIDPNKSPAKYSDREAILMSDFTDEATRQVEEWSAANGGKRPDGLKMQEILDSMVINRVFVEKPWATDAERFGYQLTEDERGKTYIPIEKIPKPDQDRISNLIRSNGKKVTTDKLQRAFAAFKLNDRALFNSIIVE